MGKSSQPLWQILLASERPLSVQEILAAADQLGKPLHKTTIYRRLDDLVAQRQVLSITFADGLKRYEVAVKKHHHHVVCETCGKVEDVVLSEDVDTQEQKIELSTGFAGIRHVLEFYGLCAKCQ